MLVFLVEMPMKLFTGRMKIKFLKTCNHSELKTKLPILRKACIVAAFKEKHENLKITTMVAAKASIHRYIGQNR